jgi:hypothetical protein
LIAQLSKRLDVPKLKPQPSPHLLAKLQIVA